MSVLGKAVQKRRGNTKSGLDKSTYECCMKQRQSGAGADDAILCGWEAGATQADKEVQRRAWSTLKGPENGID